MAEIILSAGVVVIRPVHNIPHYLMLRVFNYWDFSKGQIELEEDALQAATREVEEETTLTGLDFLWGKIYCETEKYGRGKIARYYIAQSIAGEVALPVNEALGRPEHHEFRWLNYPSARVLCNDRIMKILDWANGIVTHSTPA